jgi:hypothetical protein
MTMNTNSELSSAAAPGKPVERGQDQASQGAGVRSFDKRSGSVDVLVHAERCTKCGQWMKAGWKAVRVEGARVIAGAQSGASVEAVSRHMHRTPSGCESALAYARSRKGACLGTQP